tara:strand:+ start:2050 stop:2499 length:450 start_codon:yes stop_codon:yes gene_type:complete
MHQRHLKYLNMLFDLAKEVEPIQGARVAACVVYKNKIVGIGINSKKSDPMMIRYGMHEEAIYLHAEMAAIKESLRVIDMQDIHKATIYVARAKRPRPHSTDWITGLAKPCTGLNGDGGCAQAIRHHMFKRTVYTVENPSMKYEVIDHKY